MPGRMSMMVGPRCSACKCRMWSSTLGVLTDSKMKIKGMWFIREVQRHHQGSGKVAQEGKASNKRWILTWLPQWVNEINLSGSLGKWGKGTPQNSLAQRQGSWCIYIWAPGKHGLRGNSRCFCPIVHLGKVGSTARRQLSDKDVDPGCWKSCWRAQKDKIIWGDMVRAYLFPSVPFLPNHSCFIMTCW